MVNCSGLPAARLREYLERRLSRRGTVKPLRRLRRRDAAAWLEEALTVLPGRPFEDGLFDVQ